MTQVITELKALFTRDLNRLKNEITQYHSDAALWSIQEAISNSGGNLCLHLIGNLKTFIGKELGNVNYVRDRKNEFEGKHVPREKIYCEIDETIEAVNQGLDHVTAERLTEELSLIHI